jgi:hypothetical protein
MQLHSALSLIVAAIAVLFARRLGQHFGWIDTWNQ